MKGIVVLALALAMLTGCAAQEPPPTERPQITASCNGQVFTLPGVMLYSQANGVAADSFKWEPYSWGSELVAQIPELCYCEDFSIDVDTEYYHTFTYSLYHDTLEPEQSVTYYQNAQDFTPPDKPGRYYVTIVADWQRDDDTRGGDIYMLRLILAE